jgi:hypothetical protein
VCGVLFSDGGLIGSAFDRLNGSAAGTTVDGVLVLSYGQGIGPWHGSGCVSREAVAADGRVRMEAFSPYAGCSPSGGDAGRQIWWLLRPVASVRGHETCPIWLRTQAPQASSPNSCQRTVDSGRVEASIS